MNIYYKNKISVEDYNMLRSAVGWGDIHPEQTKASLNGSALVIAAVDGEKAIGTARLIWDRGNTALIKDVIVLPQYQGRGIGTEIMNQIMHYLRAQLKPGYSITIDLMSAMGKEKFYEKFGFVSRPRERRGAGMYSCITG